LFPSYIPFLPVFSFDYVSCIHNCIP
jgi:hypothetical protein